jgi:hypothetical protein
MSNLGNIMTHFRLVLRMGQTTGADLVQAHRSGKLSQEEWAEMIQFCRGCASAQDCPEWMDRQTAGADAPRICPNRAKFAALKAVQTEQA